MQYSAFINTAAHTTDYVIMSSIIVSIIIIIIIILIIIEVHFAMEPASIGSPVPPCRPLYRIPWRCI